MYSELVCHIWASRAICMLLCHVWVRNVFSELSACMSTSCIPMSQSLQAGASCHAVGARLSADEQCDVITVCGTPQQSVHLLTSAAAARPALRQQVTCWLVAYLLQRCCSVRRSLWSSMLVSQVAFVWRKHLWPLFVSDFVWQVGECCEVTVKARNPLSIDLAISSIVSLPYEHSLVITKVYMYDMYTGLFLWVFCSWCTVCLVTFPIELVRMAGLLKRVGSMHVHVV